MTVSKKILAIFIFFDIIKKYQLILILEVIYMISKKLVASLLLLGMSLNNCSAKDNSKLSILKNAGFTIGGITAGVLGTLLIHKIASKDEDKKQNPELVQKIAGKKYNEPSDNSKVNFKLGKPLFRIMFIDGYEKYYIKSLDKRFDALVENDMLNKLLNFSVKHFDRNKKFSEFCKELNLNAKRNYQPKYFYEQLSDRVEKHYQDSYHNNFGDILDKFDPCKLFYEVRETSEKDKLFLWVYGVSIFGKKLRIPYGSFDSEGDARSNLIVHIKEFIKNTLNLEFICAENVDDEVWLESQQFGRRAEEIEEYFIENEKK